MLNKTLRFAAIAAMSLVPSIGGADHAPQTEVALVCAEADEPQIIWDGEHTSGCEIGPASDVDQFEFSAEPGETVRIVVSRIDNPGLDPSVVIRDPQDQVIGEASVGNSNLTLEVPIETAGTHRIAISEINADETGAYTMQFVKILPTFDPPLLEFNHPASENIGFGSDVDAFEFQAIGGSTVQITISRVSNPGLDPHVEVFAPDGTLVHDDLVGNANLVTTFQPPVTGTYTAFFFDINDDEIGDYLFELQCLSSMCGPKLPVCNLDITFDQGTVDFGFDVRANEPTIWKVLLLFQGENVELVSVPMPVLDEIFSSSSPLHNFPPLGTVAFVSTFTTVSGGIVCSDFETVYTGPSAVPITVNEFRQRLSSR